MKERWKNVVGYEGLYRVSDLGRIERVGIGTDGRRPRLRFLSPFGDRYKIVNLWKDGVQTRAYVHTLVLTAFRKPRPSSMEACHRDGDGLNCRLKNLRWGTHRSNQLEASRVHGTLRCNWPGAYSIRDRREFT